jgi:hypothetical protein
VKKEVTSINIVELVYQNNIDGIKVDLNDFKLKQNDTEVILR